MNKLMVSVLAVPLVALAACGSSVHASVSVERSISGDKVAAKVKTQFTDPAQGAAAKITCGDLKAKVGATDDCTVSMGDTSFGARLTVDKAKGSDVHYTTRPFLTGEQLTKLAAQQLGASSDALKCPGIDGVQGTKVSCSVSKGTAKSVEVTVVDIKGGLFMDVDIKPQA